VENIKVLVRVRPASKSETGAGSGTYRKAVQVEPDKSELLYEGSKTFTFDHCCDETSTQVCGGRGRCFCCGHHNYRYGGGGCCRCCW
jgi:hypothetical protein